MSLLNIGDTIYLELIDEKEEKQKFKCRLVDRLRDFLFIDLPIDVKTNKVSFFYEGTQFKASFIGKDQAVYLFETQLHGRKKGRIPMLILKDPGREHYRRIQRRQHVRVDTSLDVAVHPKNNEFSPFVSVTADISGGGMALVLPIKHELSGGINVDCWIALHMQNGEIKYIKVTCHVIRIIPGKENPRDKASMEFVEIHETDRQIIIRYVFERQLYLRKKGITE